MIPAKVNEQFEGKMLDLFQFPFNFIIDIINGLSSIACDGVFQGNV